MRDGEKVNSSDLGRTNQDALAEVVSAIKRGEVVALPTETVYGLAVDPRHKDAVRGIFSLKKRPFDVALPVLVPSLASGLELVASGPDAQLVERLGKHFWPGPLTIVARRARDVEMILGGDEATIGLRCPGLEVVRVLLGTVGPLAVTSANSHGKPPCHTPAEVRQVFGDEIVVLDGGICDGTPSTVVSVLKANLEILRAGPISQDEVLQVLCGPVR